MYNGGMFSPRLRRVLALVILLVSLLILLWGIWPAAQASRVMPIPPAEIRLPDLESLILIWL
jgi:hypothetical protein